MVAAFVFALATPLPAQQPGDGERNESRRLVERIRAWIEKQRDRYDVAADRLESVGLAPEIGTLGHGSGLAAGLRFRRGITPGIDAEAAASFSYRGYERYDLRVGRIVGRESRTTLRPSDDDLTSQFDAFTDRVPGLGVYADLRYRHSPEHRFFGIGSETVAADRTSFLARCVVRSRRRIPGPQIAWRRGSRRRDGPRGRSRTGGKRAEHAGGF
jgi:hypothetical protein